MKPHTRKTGFTLMELLVSMTILLLLALMISRIFNTGSFAIRTGSNDALLDETARFVLDNLEADISQSLIRTNIPFRVEQVSVGDALYFISTAIRRTVQENPRDTAPIQLRTMATQNINSTLNRRITVEYKSGTGNVTNLVEQSDYYRSQKIAIQSSGRRMYTEPLTDIDGFTQQAVLTFMDIHINGDSASNRNIGLPSTTDLPRFVDIKIGLTAANEMRHAMRLHQNNPASADAHLSENERVYTRRIFLPNIGTTQLSFK